MAERSRASRTMIKLVDVYENGKPIPGAIEFLYEIIKERDPEINISHKALPSFDEHARFVLDRLFRLWYLIEFATPSNIQPTWVGYVSATHLNEIGIVLRKVYRGQGLGPAAIQRMMAMHRPLPAVKSWRSGCWLANIAPVNEHSKYMFQKLGFSKISETHAFPEEACHDDSNESPAHTGIAKEA